MLSKFNTLYVYQRKIEHIVHTLHYCNSGKCKTFTFKQRDKTFTFKQRDEKQITKIGKDKKKKKKKEEEGKGSAMARRTEGG